MDSHWKWIQSQILEQKKIKKRYPLKKFRSGESFLFQGKKVKLRYKKKSKEAISKTDKDSSSGFYVKKDCLIYYWSKWEDLSIDLLRKRLRTFYETVGNQLLI